jgi:hypothetical protein
MILTKGVSPAINIVDISNITIIKQQVTENISNNNLNDFLNTLLDSHNIQKENFEIYYLYSKFSSEYILFIIPKLSKINIPIPYVFSNYYIDNNVHKDIDLFITDHFFVLYIEGKIEYFKEINNHESSNEICEYVTKYLNIQIDNIYLISKEQLNNMMINYKLDPTNNINILEKNRYTIYMLILICSIILLFVYYITFEQTKLDNNTNIIKVNKNIVLPTIKAIVDNSVLIDGIWLKVGDSYNAYLIKRIDNKYIDITLNKKDYRIVNYE